LQCADQPWNPNDCPIKQGYRASRVEKNVDSFGCRKHTCVYEKCPANVNELPVALEDFCWKTCSPSTYPQGCLESATDGTQCLKCTCASTKPTPNSCGGVPSFFVNVNDLNCQKWCDVLSGKDRKQGVALADGTCSCRELSPLVCDQQCVTNQMKHGVITNAGTTCACTNLPVLKSALKKRCNAVCKLYGKIWLQKVNGQLCVCG
jgi:hypothetical protein